MDKKKTINFDNIEYLQLGNNRQRQAYTILINNEILSKLEAFDPILVGTIPINIDIKSSDLDIICCFSDKHLFQKVITDNFSKERSFSIREQPNLDSLAIIGNFFLDGFEIEIFGQSIPTKEQFAYRHLIVEHQLLNQNGEAFRQQIIDLKQQGYKSEPAFAIALGITGNPYTEILRFANANQISTNL